MCSPGPKPSPNTCAPDLRARVFRILAGLWVWLGFVPVLLPAQAKSVLIYYHLWFSAPPHSPTWGWHWTMDRFRPDRTNALGEQDIASWYQPLIGTYDSGDPVVLAYHTLLMRLAGADAVVVNWFGPEPVFDYATIDRRLHQLLPHLERTGLKLVLCYEDRALQAPAPDPGHPPPSALDRARRALQYACSAYFGRACYLRWKDRPVLLNFGPQVLRNPEDWPALVRECDPPPALFTINTPAPGAVGAFAWPPMWLSQAPGTGGVLSAAALHRYLGDFEQAAQRWPAAISCAFPRFHDIHARAGTRPYWGYLGDRGGDTFRETLTRALTNAIPMVMIATWNHFGEGTLIEPTREFGFRDLALLQQLRRQWIDPAFPPTTNELAMVWQLYQLRRAARRAAHPQTDLDAAADALANFRFEDARRLLQGFSRTPPEAAPEFQPARP